MSALLRNNLSIALSYAKLGWQVFPCFWVDDDGTCACLKSCEHKGKHPMTRDGFKSATTDPEKITAWWQDCPKANIAIRTGEESGIWVLDLDGEEGIAALKQLEAELGALPTTVSVRTGGGGMHLYFRYPPGARIGNRAGLRGLPIDVRGTNGYVLAPPSSHVEGTYYEWINPPADLA